MDDGAGVQLLSRCKALGANPGAGGDDSAVTTQPGLIRRVSRVSNRYSTHTSPPAKARLSAQQPQTPTRRNAMAPVGRAQLMLLAVALACVAGAASAAEIKTVKVWEQCGGRSCSNLKGGCGDAPWEHVKCGEGLKCGRETEWFWQCRSVAKLFGQCGGQSSSTRGMGGDHAWATCLEGECSRKNEYYWQCLNKKDIAATKASIQGARGKQQNTPATAAQAMVASTSGTWPPEGRQEVSQDQRVAQLEEWAQRLSGSAEQN